MMGGTFDPIHLGHLGAAAAAREALALDRVAFVTAHVPPHRSATSPALDRYAMVCLATAGRVEFVPSDLELRRAGPSYTADTVRALRAAHPDDALVLIVGSDTYPEMAGWREPEAIFAACEIAVVTRPGEPLPELPAGGGVRQVAGPGLSISSTEVRRRIGAGRSIHELVPDSVAEYIAKRGLYR
jgi:nicotinate-nucleotide adenylyltransferase